MKGMEEVWNIDDHRGVHESEEHWKLRRKFMERIQYEYPKMRVLSLSQVFANMEILGCRYPAATMSLVAKLGEGISDEYRLAQESFAQRTFMSASTAAEKRAKDGFHSTPAINNSNVLSRSQKSVHKASTASHFVPATESPLKPDNFGGASKAPTTDTSKCEQVQLLTSQFSNLLLKQAQKKVVANSSNGLPVITPESQPKVKVKGKPEASGHTSMTELSLDGFTEGELSECRELVLVEELYKSKCTADQILPRSCTICKRKFKVEYLPEDETGTGSRCKWILGKHSIAEGVGGTREGAKHDAYIKALQRLRQVCHTVQVKEKIVGLKHVTKDDLINSLMEPPSVESLVLAETKLHSQKHSTAPPPLSDSNVGNKLLRLMGWNGGALGKNEDGITEAIMACGSAGHKRPGLGLVEKKDEPKQRALAPGEYTQIAIKKFLNAQLNGASRTLDIVFAPEFLAREREAIHIAAQSIGLKSRSYGEKQKRILVVSRDATLHDLVDELLCIGETAKYRLIKPVIEGV